MDRVRIGFLGCGYMGQNAHLRNYVHIPGCEVVAVCDAKRGQAELIARRYGIPTVYGAAEDLLADPAIDAVVAAQPFDNHINLVPDILRAGKHLLTEKPLCLFPENGDRLADIAEACGRIHMVAYHKRSDPATEYAIDAIRRWRASGDMGRMTYVRITMPPGDWIGGADAALTTDEPYARYAPERSPAGIDEATRAAYVSFVNYYIHQVNLMRFLLGEDYEVAYADPSGRLLVTRSEGGIPGALEMATYATTDDWQESALVCFERGWIRIDLPAPLAAQRAGRATVFENDGPAGRTTSPALPNVCAMRSQAIHFVRAVRGEEAPPCDSREAAKDLRVAMAYIERMRA